MVAKWGTHKKVQLIIKINTLRFFLYALDVTNKDSHVVSKSIKNNIALKQHSYS